MSIPRSCVTAVVFAFYLGRWAMCSATEPTRPREIPIKIEITVSETRARWYVGDNIQVAVTAKNVSNHDVYLLGWNENHEGCQPQPEINMEAHEFPGQVKGLMSLWPSWGYPPAPIGKYDKISSGGRSIPVSRSFVVHLPGKVLIMAGMDGAHVEVKTKYDEPKADGKMHEGYGSYSSPCQHVRIHESMDISIEPTMSPSMAKRYEASSQIILDGLRLAANRVAELDGVARERHYFAAHFVHTMWKKAEEGPVKDAAANHLVSLLEYGTAYESLPDLLRLLGDPAALLETRQQILKVIGKMDVMGEAPGFSIADGRTFYCLSKVVGVKGVGKEAPPEFAKTELWQDIVDTLRAVSKDGNAAIAEKAAAILSAKRKEK